MVASQPMDMTRQNESGHWEPRSKEVDTNRACVMYIYNLWARVDQLFVLGMGDLQPLIGTFFC